MTPEIEHEVRLRYLRQSIYLLGVPYSRLKSPLLDLIMVKELPNNVFETEYSYLNDIVIMFIASGYDDYPNARKMVLNLAIKAFRAALNVFRQLSPDSKDIHVIDVKIDFLRSLLEKENSIINNNTKVTMSPETTTPEQPAKELTFGEKAVGISFNPSSNPEVESIKRQYADIIDSLNDKRSHTQDKEKARLYSIAITEAQAAQMWAVKAITWN
jgi:hypothetical protein